MFVLMVHIYYIVYRKEKLLWSLGSRITIRVLLLGRLRFLRMRRRVGVRGVNVRLSIVCVLGFRGGMLRAFLGRKRRLMRRSFREWLRLYQLGCWGQDTSGVAKLIVRIWQEFGIHKPKTHPCVQSHLTPNPNPSQNRVKNPTPNKPSCKNPTRTPA